MDTRAESPLDVESKAGRDTAQDAAAGAGERRGWAGAGAISVGCFRQGASPSLRVTVLKCPACDERICSFKEIRDRGGVGGQLNVTQFVRKRALGKPNAEALSAKIIAKLP